MCRSREKIETKKKTNAKLFEIELSCCSPFATVYLTYSTQATTVTAATTTKFVVNLSVVWRSGSYIVYGVRAYVTYTDSPEVFICCNKTKIKMKLKIHHVMVAAGQIIHRTHTRTL